MILYKCVSTVLLANGWYEKGSGQGFGGLVKYARGVTVSFVNPLDVVTRNHATVLRISFMKPLVTIAPLKIRPLRCCGSQLFGFYIQTEISIPICTSEHLRGNLRRNFHTKWK